MSDYKAELTRRASMAAFGSDLTRRHGYPSLAEALEAEGVVFPPAPKPTLAISEAVVTAFRFERGGINDGLRAAIRIWLREALENGFPKVPNWQKSTYRNLTGEEWPS